MTNTTTGPTEPGPDYILLELNPTKFVQTPLNASLTIDSLTPGPNSLLVDLRRSHCTVPDSSIAVVIAAGDTARVDLAITCVGVGTLGVGLPTTGPNQPSRLVVTLDGAEIGGASPNTAGLGFPGLPAGPHSVGLTGVGNSCTVAEANPQQLVIVADETVQVTFTLTCL